MEQVKKNGLDLQYIKEQEQTPELCMTAVRQNGRALQYVKEQTPELCMAAVRQYGYALKFVKEQNPEVCMAAVRQNGLALYYVNEQSPELCMSAVCQEGRALEYVKDQTPELCMAAVRQDRLALPCVKDETTRKKLDAYLPQRAQYNESIYAFLLCHKRARVYPSLSYTKDNPLQCLPELVVREIAEYMFLQFQ